MSVTQPVAGGKASLSQRGLLWGRMLDPSFLPAKDSALLPTPAPPAPVVPSKRVKPVLPPQPDPKPAISRFSDIAVAVRHALEEMDAEEASVRSAEVELAETATSATTCKTSVACASLSPAQKAIFDWLTQDLGIETRITVRKGTENLAGRPAPFTPATLSFLMSDGVFLCEVVAVLEARSGSRSTISTGAGLSLPGVSLRPTSTAAALRNLNIALEALRANKKMPATYLWSAEALHRGDADACWGLLQDVHRVYAAGRRQRSRSRGRDGKVNGDVGSSGSGGELASTTGSQNAAATIAAAPLAATAAKAGMASSTLAAIADVVTITTVQPAAASASFAPPKARGQSSKATAMQPPPPPLPSSQPLIAPPTAQPESHDFRMQPPVHHKPLKRIRPPHALHPRGGADSTAIALPASSDSPPPTLPVITEAQKSTLRSWLYSLGIGKPRTVEGAHILDNPFCNGAIMCEVLSVLAPGSLDEAISRCSRSSSNSGGRPLRRKPGWHSVCKSIGDARANVDVCVAALKVEAEVRSRAGVSVDGSSDGDVGAAIAPLQYLGHREHMLRGDMNVAWGLLWHIREAFPASHAGRHVGGPMTSSITSSQSSQHHPHDTYTKLGYSRVDVWRLERSLLSWLFAIGMLNDLVAASDSAAGGGGGVPHDFEAIDEACRNGTLLCRLVPAIGGPVVPGVFWKPHSRKLAEANIAKACNCLRELRGFSPRFLESSSAIAGGEREPLLGLLDDCHRYYDGIAPAPFWPDQATASSSTTPTQRPTPYFGQHVPPLHPQPSSSLRMPSSSTAAHQPPLARMHGNGMSTHTSRPWAADDAVPDVLPSSAYGAGVPMTSSSRHSGVTSHPPVTPHRRHEDAELYVLDVSPPSPPPPPPPPSAAAFTHTRTAAQESSGAGLFAATSSSSHTALAVAASDEGAEEFVFPDATSDPAVVHSWLTTLGIHLKKPWELLGTRALEFADGTILCRVLDVLDHRRGGIQGVERQPKTAAQRLNNIRKALQVLRMVPAMPSEHLWDEAPLRDADSSVIVPLLLQIRKAFGQHLKRN